MILDLDLWLVASAIVLIGSVIQGAIGFGANILAAPTLVLLKPDLVPGPLFIAIAALTVLTALRELSHVDRSFVAWTTIGRLPGVALGGVVLAMASRDTLQLVVGIIILVGVVLSAGVIEMRRTPTTQIVAGFSSGFCGATSSIGGPPLVLLLQRESGAYVRATIGVSFIMAVIITVPTLVLAGKLGRAEALTGLSLIPASLIGFVISGPMRRFVDGPLTRPAILVFSTVAALAVIARVLW